MYSFFIELKRPSAYKASGRNIVSRSIVFTVLPFAFQVSVGQEPTTQEVVEREPMEEVIVSSPPSLRSMATEVTKAQVNALSIFNSLNQDSEFDVLCKKERPLKSGNNPIVNYAPVLVCRTRFVRREAARDNELFIEDLDPGLSTVDYAGHAEELREKVNELTREQPELQEA